MSRRLQTVAWYLKRPALYPELVRLVLPRLVGSATADPRDSSQAEARQWCDPRAVTIDTAIEKIAGAGRQSIESLFPQVLQAAHQRAAACPVRMGGPGGLKLLYWLAEHIQATRVVETGVAYGWSSLALLLSLRKRPQAR